MVRDPSYSEMKRIVISLGGSVLVPSLESHRVAEYAAVLKAIASRAEVYVVVGGGGEARRYIAAARKMGISEAYCDDLGIQVTRLNASLLIGALGDAAAPVIPEDYRAALALKSPGKILVMGGVTPAQTTDAVAAVLSEFVGADVMVNATAVDGIYSADPKKDPSATRYARLSPGELIDIILREPMAAGSNTVIDAVAARVVQRSGIPLIVLDGRDPENFKAAVLTGTYTGTLVSESGKDPLPLE